MQKNHEVDVREMLLRAHREGVERAIDLSAWTGVPLVIEVDGVIKRIKPNYKYIRVPILPEEEDSLC